MVYYLSHPPPGAEALSADPASGYTVLSQALSLLYESFHYLGCLPAKLGGYFPSKD